MRIRWRLYPVRAAGKRTQHAFLACEFMIDKLKKDAPFWKKATRGDEQHWLTPCERD